MSHRLYNDYHEGMQQPSRTSIISEAFRRLQAARTADEAKAAIAALIQEREGGADYINDSAATKAGGGRVASHRSLDDSVSPARTNRVGFTNEGRMMDNAAHDMSQPQWETTLRNVAAPHNFPRNLSVLVLFSTVGTFEQSALAIEECMRLIELDGQGRSNNNNNIQDDTQPLDPLCVRNVNGDMAPLDDLPLLPTSNLRLVLGMMWWLPEKWACCAPNEWQRAGGIAHAFEHLLRKFAHLHVITDAVAAGAAHQDRLTTSHLNDILLCVAKRWNRSLHFRRYNDFHKAASCGFATRPPTTATHHSEAPSGDMHWIKLLQSAIADPVGVLRSATTSWLQLAPRWSQVPHDEWVHATMHLTVIRLLTSTSRLSVDHHHEDNGEDGPNEWETFCGSILAAHDGATDATTGMLRVLMMEASPSRGLFDVQHKPPSLSSKANRNESKYLRGTQPSKDVAAAVRPTAGISKSVVLQRWRALTYGDGETGAPPRAHPAATTTECAGRQNYSVWVRRYATIALASNRAESGRSRSSVDVPFVSPTSDRSTDVFLAAYFTWLLRPDDAMDVQHHGGTVVEATEATDHINKMTAAWSDVLHRQDEFANAVSESFAAHLGFHPSATILTAVHIVAAELLHVIWWNVSPTAASEWLLRIAAERPASEAMSVVVRDLAERCGQSLARGLKVDDRNDGTHVGGLPVWLATFLADPLLEPHA